MAYRSPAARNDADGDVESLREQPTRERAFISLVAGIVGCGIAALAICDPDMFSHSDWRIPLVGFGLGPGALLFGIAGFVDPRVLVGDTRGQLTAPAMPYAVRATQFVLAIVAVVVSATLRIVSL